MPLANSAELRLAHRLDVSATRSRLMIMSPRTCDQFIAVAGTGVKDGEGNVTPSTRLPTVDEF